jgi:hypothetical protein
MRKLLFVLPGYCVGVGGLVLITYRTLLAVGSESKSMLVRVNSFGEQYLDLVALLVIWTVSLIGFFSLSVVVKDSNRISAGERKAVVAWGKTPLFRVEMSDGWFPVSPSIQCSPFTGGYDVGSDSMSTSDSAFSSHVFSVSLTVLRENLLEENYG